MSKLPYYPEFLYVILRKEDNSEITPNVLLTIRALTKIRQASAIRYSKEFYLRRVFCVSDDLKLLSKDGVYTCTKWRFF